MNPRAILEHLPTLDLPLTEGLAKAKALYLTTGKIPAAEFDQLVALDPTKSKKYIEWMSKAYLDLPELEKFGVMAKFDNLVKKRLITGDKSDIHKYETIEQVYDIVKKFEDTETKGEQRRREKVEGSEEVFENDKVLVLRITTERAACYYGKGTKWCIAAREHTDNYFNKYYGKDIVDFYFLFNKILQPEDDLSKVAVAVYPDSRLEAYNAPDKHLSDDQLDKYLAEVGVDKSIFTHSGMSLNRIKARIDGTMTQDAQGFYIVTGDVDFSDLKMEKLPLKFKSCSGDFDISSATVKSLVGCPGTVGGTFDCSHNKLKNLVGSPKSVGKHFDCAGSHLKSLEGGPVQVGSFDCRRNDITTLKGAPQKVATGFTCEENKALVSLVGGPVEVGGDYNASECALTSLEGMPKILKGSVFVNENQLITLRGAPEKIYGHFDVNNNPLKSLEGAPKYVAGNFSVLDTHVDKDTPGRPRFIGGKYFTGSYYHSRRRY